MRYKKEMPRPYVAETAKPNQTGIPIQMKQNFEEKSGLSFDDVRVHYHSALPAKLGALAYTQGTQVFIGPGQECHLQHELGHVLQQKRGQVQATERLHGLNINRSPQLERNADVLAGQREENTTNGVMESSAPCDVIQMKYYQSMDEMWRKVTGDHDIINEVNQVIGSDAVLRELYDDASAQLPFCNFIGNESDINITLNGNGVGYTLRYSSYPKTPTSTTFEQNYFIAAIIHELAHAAVSRQYQRNVDFQDISPWLNLNLPPAETSDANEKEMSPEQKRSFHVQFAILTSNMEQLQKVILGDTNLPDHLKNHLSERTEYSIRSGPDVHYDTVLADMMYVLIVEDLTQTSSFHMVRQMLQEANDRRHQRAGENNLLPAKIQASEMPQPENQSRCEIF